MNKKYLYKTSFASSPVLVKKDREISKASIQNLQQIAPNYVRDNLYDLLPIVFNVAVACEGNLNGDLISTDTAINIYKNFINRPINVEHRRGDVVGHVISASLSSYSEDYKEGLGSVILNPQDVEGKNDPFNISLCGYIYKVCDPELVELLEEASDPKSSNYLVISSSWELAFNQWDILLGSSILSKGTIITDTIEKEKYRSSLKIFGGNGKYNGVPVYRIITGDVIPLGLGLTTNPAGSVQGIIALPERSKKNSQKYTKDVNNKVMAEISNADNYDGWENGQPKIEKEPYYNNVIAPNGVYPDNLPNKVENELDKESNDQAINPVEGENQDEHGLPLNLKDRLSENVNAGPGRIAQPKVPVVDSTANKGTKVTIEQKNAYDGNEATEEAIAAKVKEMVKTLASFKDFISQHKIGNVKINNSNKNNKNFMKLDELNDDTIKQLSLASFHSILADGIDEASKKFGAQIDAAKKDAEDKAAAAAKHQSMYENLQAEFGKIQAELDAEKKQRMADKAQADFNGRMTDLASKYDMDDKDCSIVAKQIRGMDDEDYASWADDFSVLASGKTKKPKIVTVDAPITTVKKIVDVKDALADIQHEIVEVTEPGPTIQHTTTEDALAQTQASLVQETLDNLKGKKSSIPNIPLVGDAKAKAAAAWDLKDLIKVGR